jgi:hypothetical protein
MKTDEYKYCKEQECLYLSWIDNRCGKDLEDPKSECIGLEQQELTEENK